MSKFYNRLNLHGCAGMCAADRRCFLIENGIRLKEVDGLHMLIKDTKQVSVLSGKQTPLWDRP